jgi:septal ring factor EnvC (AmiA/AmiB activator)
MASKRLFAIVALALVLTTAHSQTVRNADLARIRAEIARLRDRLALVRTQQQSAQQQLEEADLELGIRTRELAIAVDAQARLEQEQQSVEAQIAGIAPRIERQKRFLAKRLAALYRLGGLSYVRLLLSIDERSDPLEAMSMLSYLVSRDARAVSRFQASRAQLASRLADLADRRRRVAETRRIVESRRADVAAARAQQERLLASLRQEGTQSEQRIAELEEKAKRLERLIDTLSKQRQGLLPSTDVRALQGALPWPVQGKIVENFGKQVNAKFSTVTFSNGWKIAARPGTDVRAVYPGTVLFSQWFKGYGNLVILDHGNRVFSLYGNLKSPAVAAGDHVNAGQSIAGVGESEDAQSGYLYFEIRHDNKPEDPRKWLR